MNKSKQLLQMNSYLYVQITCIMVWRGWEWTWEDNDDWLLSFNLHIQSVGGMVKTKGIAVFQGSTFAKICLKISHTIAYSLLSSFPCSVWFYGPVSPSPKPVCCSSSLSPDISAFTGLWSHLLKFFAPEFTNSPRCTAQNDCDNNF
jgi:hypothetical protein